MKSDQELGQELASGSSSCVAAVNGARSRLSRLSTAGVVVQCLGTCLFLPKRCR